MLGPARQTLSQRQFGSVSCLDASLNIKKALYIVIEFNMLLVLSRLVLQLKSLL